MGERETDRRIWAEQLCYKAVFQSSQ
jgi:hypothetical protein